MIHLFFDTFAYNSILLLTVFDICNVSLCVRVNARARVCVRRGRGDWTISQQNARHDSGMLGYADATEKRLVNISNDRGTTIFSASSPRRIATSVEIFYSVGNYLPFDKAPHWWGFESRTGLLCARKKWALFHIRRPFLLKRISFVIGSSFVPCQTFGAIVERWFNDLLPSG